MSDRTNLDVAAEAIARNHSTLTGPKVDRIAREDARAGLDAIHPALAHLTPDDVAALFEQARCITSAILLFPEHAGPQALALRHAVEVLNRD